jgi:hypothetical protein
MRLIGAGLFVFASMLAAVAALGSLGSLDRAPAWLIGLLIGLFMLVMTGVALWLFNSKRSNVLGHKTLEEQIRELEQQGLLESTTFQATRAFGVEEYEDEGLSYFLELSDGRVVFLTGQYLYEYEPDEDEPQARAFPCSEFSIRRHKTERYVVDVQCRGSVLEPEAVARPFDADDWKHARVPEDGEVITARTYDALKSEQLSR